VCMSDNVNLFYLNVMFIYYMFTLMLKKNKQNEHIVRNKKNE